MVRCGTDSTSPLGEGISSLLFFRRHLQMVQMERMAMDSTSLKGLVATSTGDRLLWVDLCWEFVLPLAKCKCANFLW